MIALVRAFFVELRVKQPAIRLENAMTIAVRIE